jgi:hypothetical protein
MTDFRSENNRTPVSDFRGERSRSPMSDIRSEKNKSPVSEFGSESIKSPFSNFRSERSRSPVPEFRCERSRSPVPEFISERNKSPMSDIRSERSRCSLLGIRSPVHDQRSEQSRSPVPDFRAESNRSPVDFVTDRNRSPLSSDRVVSETEISTESALKGIKQSSDALKGELESLIQRKFGIDPRRVENNTNMEVPKQDIFRGASDTYSNSYLQCYSDGSSGRGVIGDPVATSTPKICGHVWKPVATSTPKSENHRVVAGIMDKGIYRPLGIFEFFHVRTCTVL